jgi:nucleotide-binding universal stress UspA family protein
VVSYSYPLLALTAIERDRSLIPDAARLFDEAERELGGVAITTRTAAASSPARALHDIATDEGADLIVVGSTHRGSLGRVLPGSVGERLLNGAPCAVAVAPRGFARGEHFGLGIVGVGYDGSEESRLALHQATRLAARLDATLRLIAVVPPKPRERAAGHAPPSREDLDRRLQEGVETVLLDGDPAATLADQGVELDLLVVGSRDYGPLLRTMLGGVAAKVIRTAPCPVLVVPRGGEGNREV